MAGSGLIAVTAGWIVTEAGRQPFTVYGLLRTADSDAPIDAPAVAPSLAAFALVYFAVFGAGLGLLFRLFAKTPQAHEEGPPPGQPIPSAGIPPRPALAETHTPHPAASEMTRGRAK